MWRPSDRKVHARIAAVAVWALLLPAASVLIGCGPAGGAGTPEAADEASTTLIVFAASSLTDAFRDIGAFYELENPGNRVEFQFAGSSQLRIQLEEGAEADVFASANPSQMDQAQAAGLIGGPVRIFAQNHLVIIHPADNPADIRSIGDLAREGVRLVTATPEVPIGAYTLEMLDRADRDGAFGQDFKRRVLANVVSKEPNVRQVVAKVRLGEADAAVVYASDVTPDVRPHVGAVTIPGAYNVIASYPLAVLENAPHPAAARNFVELVLGPEGQRILQAAGIPAGCGRRIMIRRQSGLNGIAASGIGRSLGYALARAGWVGALLVFVLLLVLPVLAILLRSLSSGEFPAALGSPLLMQALRLTAETSLVSTGLAALLGTPVAYLLARRAFPGRALLDHLIELPMILPPAVAGLGLLMAFGRRGLLGEPLETLGLTLSFTTTAVVMAQFFVAAPLFVRAARAGFQAVDRELETVAHTLGVSSGRTFWRVTVPIAFPSLLGGLVMCWARAIGEFGATIMFAGSFPGRTQTMPLAIYAALEHDLEAALAIAAVLVAFSFAVLVLLRLAVRRWGDSGA